MPFLLAFFALIAIAAAVYAGYQRSRANYYQNELASVILTSLAIARQSALGDVFNAIEAANPQRNWDNVNRRIIKLGEELGELSEAYLNVTSTANGKGKTFEDVREEAADLLIVAADVALTPTPDQKGLSSEQIRQELVGYGMKAGAVRSQRRLSSSLNTRIFVSFGIVRVV